MQFIELFAGVGGFHLGITQALQGGVCVYANEWDKYAAQTYSKNFKGDYLDTTDITNVATTDIPGHDCLVGGFPCQSFSIAGKRRGFEETRGTLFFEIARLLAHHRPGHLVLENVEGLLTHDTGKTFATVLRVLADLGYRVEWQVLNSSNFGVPQSRKRVYIIGHLRDRCTQQIFPLIGSNEVHNAAGASEKEIHAGTLTARQYASWNGNFVNEARGGTLRTHNDGKGARMTADGLAPTLPARARDDGSGQAIVLIPNVDRGDGERSVTHTEGDIVPTLRATHYKSGDNQPKIAIPVLTPDRPVKRQNGRRFKEDGEPAFTVNTIDRHGVMVREANKQGFAVAEPGDSISLRHPSSKTRRGRVGKGIAGTLDTGEPQAVLTDMAIRRLTPIECERLQGFPDNWTAGVSDSQRYKQMGNAVTVNVVKAIFERLNEQCKLNK